MNEETTDGSRSSRQNRSGLWALIGVAVGFSLPILACVCGMFVLSVGFSTLAGQAAGAPASGPVHVSGPASGPAVALLELSGPIVSGRTPPFSSTPLIASDDVIPLIEQAGANDEVKALVLRINSPGGAVVPSDRIYHALTRLDKPIVVIMGDLAASGGLYISMSADYIIANPNTLTGSIGVISQFPNAEELLDKLGIEFTVIKSGEIKDIGSPFRPMSDREQQLWQQIIDETYNRFVSIVAGSRGLSEEEVREIADGRILSASQAREQGLIDEIGYEADAIAEAASRGDITGEPRVVEYRRRPLFLDLLGGRTATSWLPFTALPADWMQRLLAPSLEYRWVP